MFVGCSFNVLRSSKVFSGFFSRVFQRFSSFSKIFPRFFYVFFGFPGVFHRFFWPQKVTEAQLSSVKIFARLSPFQKEQIIQAAKRGVPGCKSCEKIFFFFKVFFFFLNVVFSLLVF